MPPQNILLLIEIEPLVLDMRCSYSLLMIFREEDTYDLESYKATLNFFNFL